MILWNWKLQIWSLFLQHAVVVQPGNKKSHYSYPIVSNVAGKEFGLAVSETGSLLGHRGFLSFKSSPSSHDRETLFFGLGTSLWECFRAPVLTLDSAWQPGRTGEEMVMHWWRDFSWLALSVWSMLPPSGRCTTQAVFLWQQLCPPDGIILNPLITIQYLETSWI